MIVDTRNEDISEVTEQTVVAQSVKEKITKLNLESATSTDTEQGNQDQLPLIISTFMTFMTRKR